MDQTEKQPANRSAGSGELAHIQAVKARYESDLLGKANVVSVGIGLPVRCGKPVEEPGIIVSVTHKVRASDLAPDDLIPQMLEDVRVWVEEVGRLKAGNRPSASNQPKVSP